MTDLASTMVTPSIPVSREIPVKVVTLSLSQVLRARTEVAHKDVEGRLALPGSINSLADYQACLVAFYQLYRPLEVEFQRFSDWATFGIDVSGCSLSGRLAADLQALGAFVPDSSLAPASSLPRLREFGSALGACYVMEGSALGSQFMLPQLQQTLGDGMNGADSFFRGRGRETAAFWKRFRASLDLYGELHPEEMAGVVSAAIATFEAIGLWMEPIGRSNQP